ncbi:DUF1840 family protein, partial [Caballeronia sp. RCC_10]|uniref:DUF1840 family protein n=1 Tax=Caballeronia sp. RCC_10 TaxID=3239227 RepID=UPI003525350F
NRQLDDPGASTYKLDLTVRTNGATSVLNDDERIAHEHGAMFHPLSHTDVRTGIGLHSRALPFLDMLRQAKRSEADIIWGL